MFGLKFKRNALGAVGRHLEQRIRDLLGDDEDKNKRHHRIREASEALRDFESDHVLNLLLAQHEMTRKRVTAFKDAYACLHAFAHEKHEVEEGALVEVSELERGKLRQALYFVLTGAGGERVASAGRRRAIQIISPKSPRAQALFGKKVGDTAQLTGRGERAGQIMRMAVLSVV